MRTLKPDARRAKSGSGRNGTFPAQGLSTRRAPWHLAMRGSLRGPPAILKAKVCLVGDAGVGKTSLVRRYVLDQFDDRYITTLGAKVTKKELRLDDPRGGGPVVVDLTIWDIMGQSSFRELLREAYFRDTQAVLAVADLTRRETLDHLPAWIDAVGRTVGAVPVVVAANKADLADRAEYGAAEVDAVARSLGGESFATSAKTGDHIEAAFRRLATLVADAQLRRPQA
jgi:small GTP-binding protein